MLPLLKLEFKKKKKENNNKNQTNTSKFVVLLQCVNGFADLAEDLLHWQLGVHLQGNHRKNSHSSVHKFKSWGKKNGKIEL